ncbi:AraC family transcriptional regulator [Larkinella terrae]|uniref:Helix-turn-helix domain-containing protein n=1 Tax=Larkinella terrae TaxID=2025311 RepID=A0A7K0EL59_9BACT|nr:AraC family transcriptional regulator [Larkinella terrae]MRS62188.1 helix-turn-helix domain-containing protein [Larkinella terrae]
MKPLLFRVPTVDDRSFRVQVDDGPHFYDRLHFHPELQLTLIKESVGTQVVGDRIDRFRPYDLLLLGANLPHVFRNDPAYFDPKTTQRSLSYSVYLRPEHLQESFFGLPELNHLNQLFQEARHGVRIRFNEPVSTTTYMEQLHTLRPFEQLMTLLTVLDRMAANPNRELLSVTAYEQPRRPDDHQRLDNVFTYILNQYASPITLEDVAAQAHLTPSAFCRFFRLHTRKTYSQLLNEVRIEHACRLLQESKLPISQIAFSCGYTNLSNFNRQFKLINNLTPGQYIKALF